MRTHIRVGITSLFVLGLSGAMITACSPSDRPSDQPSDGANTTQSQAPGQSRGMEQSVDFDLQAHRGGRGETTEESRLAFEKALDLGVHTLELDVIMSKDGVPVVWHDPDVQAEKCRDTEAATAHDPQFPYVGKDLHDLTWEQIQTLRCDVPLEDFPEQEVATDNHMLQLSDVFELTANRGADVNFNIETKIEGEEHERSASPEEFVNAILNEVDNAGVASKVTIQSFDWRSLPLVKERNPEILTAALYDSTTWKEGSPWLGPISYKDFGDDVLRAIQELGADISSPDFELIDDPSYVSQAHELGIKVLPWTVNEKDDMNRLIDMGVDGIITDYPTRLREVLGQRDIPLPPSFPRNA